MHLLQVAEKLRQDPRVVVIDRTNLRYLRLQDLPEAPQPVDLISLDLSFISVLKVMEAVCDILKPEGILIVLIKPQFEAGRTQVSGIQASFHHSDLLAMHCCLIAKADAIVSHTATISQAAGFAERM